MRIQPVQGSGMNAGYDAATKSVTISNEGNTPFIYVRVNNKIQVDESDISKGYYLFYEFQEVSWNGKDFSTIEGGLSASYDSRETCPKMYAMPYDIDEPSNIGNFSGNIGIGGQGLVYLARYRGVDSSDGRDVYEFLRSLDPSTKVLIQIDDEFDFIDNYYSCTSTGSLDQSTSFQNIFWAKELNGSELVASRKYIGFYTGQSFDPYPDDPENSDSRPVVTVINTQIAGPTGITVVTDISCVGGSMSATYGTFYPSESAYITQDTKKTFISLTDTPSSYTGAANYYIAVNPSANGLVFTASTPSETVTPVLSFINLKDCPSSYPSDPAVGNIVITKVQGQSKLQMQNISFITGNYSVHPSTSSLTSGIYFKLVNDEQTPGANKYYGTNSQGVKGWWDLPGV